MANAITLSFEPALPAAAQWKGDGVSIAPAAPCARWSLRLPAASAERLTQVAGFRIAVDINRSAGENGRLTARLGPDEWLLCAPLDAAGEIEAVLATALGQEPHALVDVAHRYAAVEIEGPRAPILLAAGCPLDLHPTVLVSGTATRTLLGKAEIILWRLHDAPAFRIECGRSFAPYVYAFLREAAREFA